ncbi:MAG: hypothetical protein ACI8YQ_000759 [Polaribacter sp.]|jgi:hypothetical protein
MKFILTLLSIAGLSALAQFYFPWWVMTIVCFLIGGVAGMKGFGSFLTGFLAIAILWGGYAFYLDMESAGILSARMAEIPEGLGVDGKMLILVTALIGGLVGGMATLTGSLGRWGFR